MKSRALLLCTMLVSSSLIIAQPTENPSTGPVAIPRVKLCSSIEQIFGFKNDSPVKLNQLKNFLNVTSKYCSFEPRATAEEIMQLSSADNIYYSCKDISEELNFTATVSFSYVSPAGPVKQSIKIRLVPPDETPPTKLTTPPAPAAPAVQSSPNEPPKNPTHQVNQPQ